MDRDRVEVPLQILVLLELQGLLDLVDSTHIVGVGSGFYLLVLKLRLQLVLQPESQGPHSQGGVCARGCC